MTDEEDIDTMADKLLRIADEENVGRIAHKILGLFAGQARADCWVAVAFAMAHSTRDNESAAAWIPLGVIRIIQRLQDTDGDDKC